MSVKSETVKQVGGMLHAQQIMLRVLRGGSYPAPLCGDVERSINYLEQLNHLTEKQLAVMKKELQAETKAAKTADGSDTSHLEIIPTPEVTTEVPKIE